MAWPTTADGLWYIFDGQVLIPVDPSTGAPIIMLRPQGGIGVGIPAIADGPPGTHAAIDETINFTALAPTDPTADSASWTTLTPPTDMVPGLYRLNLALHTGQDGANGTTAIDLSTIGGTAVAGYMIKVNAGATGFDFIAPKVGDSFLPATINNTTAGTTNSTLAVRTIPAQPFDCRIEAVGYTIVTQNGGPDVIVDLFARLNGETGGNIIASCQGVGGTERLTLTSAPVAGSVDTFDKVLAGNTATVHLRAEQRSGSNSYTTSNSTTRFKVRVCPVP